MAITITSLEKAVGGLSTPSKMPGFSYGIPAKDCMLGSILAKKEGSVCNSCYALKGMYVFPVVKKAQANRLAILRKDIWKWRENMIALLSAKYRNRTGDARVFRWHDSGDLQSFEHLQAIVDIARALPDIRFWLPTRERKLVALWILAHREFPSNLTVRVSMPMIGQEAMGNYHFVQSTVGAGTGFLCPAKDQGNECRDCRACWNNSVKSVDYRLH